MSEPAAAVRIQRAGDRALLVTPGRGDCLDNIVGRVRSGGLAGVQDVLPAAETVLITLEASAEPTAVGLALRDLITRSPDTESGSGAAATDEVVIPVRYDGADLDDVAELLGVSVDEVIARHTGYVWRCRFIGFTAGFGYLAAAGAGLTVPRRRQSRTAVPPGAIGLADGYSAIYPRRAPGGWQLIGSTEASMWDVNRDRPALLSAGTRVRFARVET